MPQEKAPLAFVKMQAAGNDFVLIDVTGGGRRSWPALTRRLCAHHLGVGSDGLLVVERGTRAPFRMRMFNPDGSEDMCGNGLRCVAAFLVRRGYVDEPAFNIQTLSGLRQVQVSQKGKKLVVAANLGPPRLRAQEIPAVSKAVRVIDHPLKVGAQPLRITALSTGTPHAVVFADDKLDFNLLAPLIMSNPFFPEQTSVSFVKAESANRLLARTWERGGVGESLGCGTGAAAILAAAHLKGLTAREADVVYPGGTIHVRWDANNNLWISGPATEVFRGEIES